MVSNEVFVGAGVSVTLIPESRINLGNQCYKSYGLSSDNKNTLVRYSVGALFRNNYKLIPDLYTGCQVALFDGTSTTYQTITSNDIDSIYLSGKLSDFPDLSGATAYMEIQPLGAPLPAPILKGAVAVKTYENATLLADQTSITVADETIYNIGDRLYSDNTLNTLLGEVISTASGSLVFNSTITETASVTNGSPSVTMSSNVDGIIKAGSTISIDNGNAVVSYLVKSVNNTAVVLTTNYAGTTNAARDVTLGKKNTNTLSNAALYVDEGRTLLSDNWLGLVNTVSPPSVEVEMKQLNLTLSGSRNFAYQYKGAETVSGGSMDLSLNNGSWLYYALGKMSALSATTTATNPSDTHNRTSPAANELYLVDDVKTDDQSGPYFHRGIKGSTALIPPLAGGQVVGNTKLVNTLPNITGTTLSNPFTYVFGEADNERLPSFALEVNYEKGSLTTPQVDNLNPHENVKSDIIVGNQLNTLTLNFEEGQELKTSLDFSALRKFGSPNKYVLKNYRGTDLDTTINTNLQNFSSVDSFNKPFFYFDGTIKMFGQPFARVKTGSLTITNNLTQHRFIGNYNRQRMSTQIPGQRTYELSFTSLVTDSTIADALRTDLEYGGVAEGQEIELTFTKDNNEQISIVLKDYLISASSWSIPDDKGPIECEMTVMARNLETCTYTGAWMLQG